MAERPKILMLDDDEVLLEIYKELFSRLPSQPDIRTTSSGARAIALLESEPYSMLVSDLRMPHMDGLEVLAVVRRKFPGLRTVVLTALTDEHFRMRAYSLGLDLYLEKPSTPQGTQLVLDCIESLLGQTPQQGGFRGMQSKGLVDIIQLECLCQSSSDLKITNGSQTARIWFLDGQIIDSETQELIGVDAFRKILTWKTGNFELLPADAGRTRTIRDSYQGLLLETAQAIDESHADSLLQPSADSDQAAAKVSPRSAAGIGQNKGVEFALLLSTQAGGGTDSWAMENPQAMAEWTRKTLDEFNLIGNRLKVGTLKNFTGLGLHFNVVLTEKADNHFCIGLERSLSYEEIQQKLTALLQPWES